MEIFPVIIRATHSKQDDTEKPFLSIQETAAPPQPPFLNLIKLKFNTPTSICWKRPAGVFFIFLSPIKQCQETIASLCPFVSS